MQIAEFEINFDKLLANSSPTSKFILHIIATAVACYVAFYMPNA